jgi:hypothetical protein
MYLHTQNAIRYPSIYEFSDFVLKIQSRELVRCIKHKHDSYSRLMIYTAKILKRFLIKLLFRSR